MPTRTQRGETSWHRPGDRPCDWMRAGLVAYKLCDRDGDCEHCPLDAALRGDRPQVAEQAPPLAELFPSRRWQFPADRLYHRGHLWVLQQQPGVLRCGVDALVLLLLPDRGQRVLPAAHSLLSEGKVAMWLGTPDEQLVPLLAPASGQVLRRNPRLAKQPRLLGEDPYGEGWLFELRGELDPALPGLCDAATMRARAEQQREELQRRIHDRLAEQHPELRHLAADGGELSAELGQLLGPQMLTEMVRILLC